MMAVPCGFEGPNQEYHNKTDEQADLQKKKDTIIGDNSKRDEKQKITYCSLHK
jgi:hypothetical protein